MVVRAATSARSPPRPPTSLRADAARARRGDRVDRSGPAAGVSIGVNLGRAAGAGIEHVHIHLVPRLIGDTNFMPVIDEVRVLRRSWAERQAPPARLRAAGQRDTHKSPRFGTERPRCATPGPRRCESEARSARNGRQCDNRSSAIGAIVHCGERRNGPRA